MDFHETSLKLKLYILLGANISHQKITFELMIFRTGEYTKPLGLNRFLSILVGLNANQVTFLHILSQCTSVRFDLLEQQDEGKDEG